MNKISSSHNESIDCLRGVAVLWVILLHLNIRVPFKESALGALFPDFLYKFIFWSGYYGVWIFFVLSGFLITTSALNKWGTLPHIQPLGFYRIRFARILPLLFALLVILSGLHLAGCSGYVISPERTSLGESLISALTFRINWLEIASGYLPASWDVLWTLSIEGMFYLAFPLLCLICRREKEFALVLCLFIVLSSLARIFLYPDNELGDRNNFANMDGLAFGCLAALAAARLSFRKDQRRWFQRMGWLLMGVVLFLRTPLYQLGISTLGLNVSLLSLGTSLLLIGWQNNRTASRFPYLGALRAMGRNSYEIYLTHLFVILSMVAVFEYFELSGSWIYLLYAVSIGLSAYLGQWVAKYYSAPLSAKFRNLRK